MYGCRRVPLGLIIAAFVLRRSTEIDIVKQIIVLVLVFPGFGSSKLMQAFEKILTKIIRESFILLSSSDEVRKNVAGPDQERDVGAAAFRVGARASSRVRFRKHAQS